MELEIKFCKFLLFKNIYLHIKISRKPITSVFKNAGSFEDIMKVLSSHPRATNFRRNIASDVLVVDNRLATTTAANEPNERQGQKVGLRRF